MSRLLEQLNRENMRLGAVVLCGGMARRMGGQDKGLVLLGGKPMAKWVLDVIRPQVHDLVINANRNTESYAALNTNVVQDEHTGYAGPLAGLSAAMQNLGTDFTFMCPCDSPFINGSIVESLGLAVLQHSADVAVATDGERMQPVFCVVHKRVLPSLNAYLDSGERKIDRWFARCNTVEVNCSDFSASFRNINTEEERALAEQELLT